MLLGALPRHIAVPQTSFSSEMCVSECVSLNLGSTKSDTNQTAVDVDGNAIQVNQGGL